MVNYSSLQELMRIDMVLHCDFHTNCFFELANIDEFNIVDDSQSRIEIL